jgi:hypothetical protein
MRGPLFFYDIDEEGSRTLNKEESGVYENNKKVRDLTDEDF